MRVGVGLEGVLFRYAVAIAWMVCDFHCGQELSQEHRDL
jgi:hypothetical protein